MSPLFSATKTRPSGEKRIVVGAVSPENTMDSENPAGKVAPSTTATPGLRRQIKAVQAQTHRGNKFSNFLILPHRGNIR